MPELPEVEVVRRGLDQHVVGATLVRVTDVHPRGVVGSTGRQFGARVRGGRILPLGRHGKYLLLPLDNGWTIVAHLRMSGKFLIARPADPTPPYARVQLHLDDGRRLCYCDVRTLGHLRAVPTDALQSDPSLAVLGVDALSRQFTPAYLHARLRRSRQPLKVFLLDQSHVAGIGNIYASEICFLAGLRPTRRANRVSRVAAHHLHRLIRQELRRAIRAGGTTFDENSPNLYLGADGKPGRHGRRLRVYGRTGLPCRVCGEPIKRLVQQQRSSFYCPRCQQ